MLIKMAFIIDCHAATEHLTMIVAVANGSPHDDTSRRIFTAVDAFYTTRRQRRCLSHGHSLMNDDIRRRDRDDMLTRYGGAVIFMPFTPALRAKHQPPRQGWRPRRSARPPPRASRLLRRSAMRADCSRRTTLLMMMREAADFGEMQRAFLFCRTYAQSAALKPALVGMTWWRPCHAPAVPPLKRAAADAFRHEPACRDEASATQYHTPPQPPPAPPPPPNYREYFFLLRLMMATAHATSRNLGCSPMCRPHTCYFRQAIGGISR